MIERKISKRIKVAMRDQGARIDIFISTHCPDISRTYAQKLIKHGKILLNNKKVKAHSVVKTGDVVILMKEEKQSIPPYGYEQLKLNVIYEDKNIIIIDKPAGIIVHPTETSLNRPTVVHTLIAHKKTLSKVGDKLRPGIVHRLDKDTSGILIIAKNNKAHDYLTQAFKNRKIHKTYLGLVKGRFSTKAGKIEAPLYRSYKTKRKFTVSSHRNSKEAITQFKVLKEFKETSLVIIEMATGRTHQIRVHFNAIHHPVVGDILYGDKKVNRTFSKLGLTRQFLHAYKIKFALPDSAKESEFTSPLPEELEKVLDQCQVTAH